MIRADPFAARGIDEELGKEAHLQKESGEIT